MFVVMLLLYIIAGNLFEHVHFHMLHETGLGIIMGFLFGMVIYFADREVLDGDIFSQDLFFYGILPLIIFAGGFNLKKRKFFKNIFYITLYGMAGTIIAFAVISGLTFLLSETGMIQDWKGNKLTMNIELSMLFGATLCASDSVAALTLIKSDSYPKLFSIVFGEGMVNDAVSIILFKAVYEILAGGDADKGFSLSSVVQIILHFLLNLVVSLGVGAFFALLSAFFFKRCRFMHQNTVAEVTALFLFGFLGYAILEWMNFSGVIGVLVAGIVMGHYTIYNLSLSGQLATCITFQTFSQLAESFLFVYLGFIFWSYVPAENYSYTWSWSFILLQVAICLIARFCAIFVLSGLVALFKRQTWSVDPAELAIVWFAGAIRGSVAFALILTIDSAIVDQPHLIELLRSSVLAIVFLTTIIGGGAMPCYINFMLARSKNNLALNKDSEIEPLLEPKKPGFFKMFD